MQIVIDIPNETYEKIKKSCYSLNYVIYGLKSEENRELFFQLMNAILDGTPLPEHHGRLIDELDIDLFAPSLGTDEYITDLMAKHNIDYVNGDDEDKVRVFALDLIRSCMNVVDTAPTIIEADKEVDE